jgi:hypothetical protein
VSGKSTELQESLQKRFDKEFPDRCPLCGKLNNMDKIDDKQKDGYANTFMLAFEKEGLTRTEVAEIFECNPVHSHGLRIRITGPCIPLLTWNK